MGTNMAITYTYDQSENLVLVKGVGVISIQELSQFADKVSGDMNIKDGFIEIIDLSECTDLQVSYDNSPKLTKDWDKWKHKSHKGSIMYAPTDHIYGITRMLQTLTVMKSSSKAAPHLVARNKDEIPELIRKIRV
jgi:hypothetical protein